MITSTGLSTQGLGPPHQALQRQDVSTAQTEEQKDPKFNNHIGKILTNIKD
jgi:hypothetical protein